MLTPFQFRNYNFKLILYVICLSVIGVFMVGSARESLQQRQLGGVAFGIFIMLVISFINYSFVLKFYWLLYGLNICLLVLVAVFGTAKGGAQRWVNLFGIQFQPSETAKILLILFFAAFLMKHHEEINTIKYIGISIVLFLPVLLLIYKQPDMSTSIMVCLLFCVLLFVGGISLKLVAGVLAIAIPVFIIALTLVLQPDQTLIEDYQQNRILAWLNPVEYANAEAYQQTNSVMAIGSGQLLGKGYKNNEVSSVKNGNFISEPQTDFIFAVVGEELGFVGSCAVIVLLIFISIECIILAMKAKDIAGSVICAGVGCLIAFQGFINISVATQVIPNTGIPLPFVSYGLTSVVSLYMGVGFVLNVGLQRKRQTTSILS
ncbi:MAG: FtsW/RodA/SpoVE family cell cycle protein [Clostridiales bacterium]|nr:FtsW/RodA/SpoVE family cell cycle protein [Clostridiales bacterium]